MQPRVAPGQLGSGAAVGRREDVRDVELRPLIDAADLERLQHRQEGDVDDGAAAATTLRGRKKSYDARADIGHWLRHDYA